MLKKIINVLNRIIPKGNIVIFNSFPNVSGNALSVYECLMKNHFDFVRDYKIIWMLNDSKFDAAEKILKTISPAQNYTLCKKKSIKGLWLYCRAKYIITTHNYITGVYTSRNQKHINLWHGMPFKTIGNAILVETGKDHIQGDYTIATSPVFQKIMANAFGLPKEKVLITGQPCSDLLFANHGALQKLSINKECYKKVIMWMPTYRKSVVGAIRDDGNSDGFGVVSVFREHFDELNNKLKEHEYLLLIKPHPMDAINTIEFRESAHIKVVHNVDLEQKQVILYELLGEVDLLLTDYSSVFIDYLVLNKPIAFVFDDLDSYSETRGFSLKNPMEYLPGERITDFSQLLNYLENIDSINDGWRENRENITRLFHSYFDDKSSERVCKAIFDKNNLSV